MTNPMEEEVRAALDDEGFLRPGALAAPDPNACFTVFVQRSDARLELASLQRNGASFFAARLGLALPKRYETGRVPPAEDAALFIVASAEGRGVPRVAFGRARTQDDLEAARSAERAMGGGGLGGLAGRCSFVWLLPASAEDDEPALRLAGIFASVGLGPILPPGRREIFGVRSVRLRLGV